MTDAELQGIAMQALNLAKKDCECKSKFKGLIACWYEGEPLRRMTTVETAIVEKLGPDWLDHGYKKDHAFQILRAACDALKPDAMVFVTATNMFEPTAKLIQLGEKAVKKLVQETHDAHHQAVRDGLLSIQDALIATAQTPQRVCLYRQPYRNSEFIGRPEVALFAQVEFGGRLKMYGESNERYFASKKHAQ